jgi:tetratricopeptide (TPR) repeat protein
MKQNSKSIKIDISDIDPKSILDSKSIIQEEALNNLIEILEEDLGKCIKQKDPIFKNRVHNTIFVNGERGSGKTQFLLSIKERVKKRAKERNKRSKKLKKLYFYDPIDPTLLHDNESFLTIIIAKILNDIERQSHYLKQDNEKFYRLINDLSDAIDGIINGGYQTKSSLENISQDQTSLRLEEYLHEFFGYIAHILDKDRLLLLIDDVDMAFDKGFEVLEVVRKYLSSPFIIPIITGDIKLYETIVENNFIKKIDSSKKDNYTPINKQISKDYLLKVLPGHRRIYIQTLYQLSYKVDIDFKLSEKCTFRLRVQSTSIKTNDDIKYFRDIMNNIIHSKIGTEKVIKNLFSSSLRNIIQFFHGEYMEDKKRFSIQNIDDIKSAEYKYNLFLLKDVLTWHTYFEEGKELLLLDNLDDAIKNFKKSLKLKDKGETYYYLGMVYMKQNNNTEAEKSFKKAIDLNYINAYIGLGNLYRIEKIYSTAIENYEKYSDIIKFHKDCELIYNLGKCYLNIDKVKEAKEKYDKTIECNIYYYKAYIALRELNTVSNRPIINENQLRDGLIQILDNKKEYLKIFDIFDILEYINSKDDNSEEVFINEVDTKFKEWKDKYKDTSYREWNFEALDKYAKNIKNIKKREMFEKYLNMFKEAM